jgi:hypothetical protein
MSLSRVLLLAGLVLAFAGCGGGTSGDSGSPGGPVVTTAGSEDTARFEIDNAKQFVLFASGNDPGNAVTVTRDYIATVRKYVDVIGLQVAKNELAGTAKEIRSHCKKCAVALDEAQSQLG